MTVRHIAWLNAVPKKAKNDTSDTESPSRLEVLQKKKQEPVMPPCNVPGQLLEYFWEVGPVVAGGMGSGPITHEEIKAWMSNTGVKLNSWQARSLKRLSRDYLTESSRATSASALPPWDAGAASAEHKRQVAAELMAAMRKLYED